MQVHVDNEVFQAVVSSLIDERDTPNSVLRRLLKLDGKPSQPAVPPTPVQPKAGAPWIVKGVLFEHGTVLRGRYRGNVYEAHVDNGSLVYNHQRWSHPSPPATLIRGNPVNGWDFWMVQRGDRWMPIGDLRLDVPRREASSLSAVIPNEKSMVDPILAFLGSSDRVFTHNEVIQGMLRHFNLPTSVTKQRNKSGHGVLNNRIGWAKQHLKERTLVQMESRNRWRITPAGRAVLSYKGGTTS